MNRTHSMLFVGAILLLATSAPAQDSYTVYRQLTIIHTNDIHSHLLGHDPERDYTPLTTGDDGTKGGLARIATLIADIRAEETTARDSVFYFDAGDFAMGTLHHVIAPAWSSELRTLHALGCDATTFGNHEFDWGPLATAYIVRDAGGERVPIVASNMVLSSTSPADDLLAAQVANGFIVPHLIKTAPNGLKIGVFGLMGIAAARVVPQSAPVTFADPFATAAAKVQELRAAGVDVVIALSHSGVSADPAHSEDELIAKLVPGIDVIVSGHSHTRLDQPIVVTNPTTHRPTFIVQAGEYGEHVGVLDLKIFKNRPNELERYRLLPIDDQVEGDPIVDDQIAGYTALVNAAVAPLSATMGLAETEFPVTRPVMAEQPIGNLLTDGIRAVVSQVTAPVDHRAVDVAVEAAGQIRAGLVPGLTGVIQLSDAFRVAPLGIGPNQIPGYPLLVYYLSASELRAIAEVAATLAWIQGEDFFLQYSGMRFTYDPNGIPFQRVIAVELGSELTGYTALDTSAANTHLYKVSANLYLSSFVALLGSLSGGALTIVPKDELGNPVTNLYDRLVDRDPSTSAVEELKEWQALIGYLAALPDTDGDQIPNVPLLYAQALGRVRAVSGASEKGSDVAARCR